MARENAVQAGDQPFLVKFFDPKINAQDFRGRTLDDILKYNDNQLESGHDYIQIIFPLPEESMFSWTAPTIDKQTFDFFRSRQDLRASLERAFTRILDFYGFDVELQASARPIITLSSSHQAKFRNWVVRMDHNHLRISRILRSLRVLGLEDHATAYFNALLDVNKDFPGRIGARSIMYWERAAKRPLYLAPDEDDDDTITGPQFLIDYEMSKTSDKARSSAT